MGRQAVAGRVVTVLPARRPGGFGPVPGAGGPREARRTEAVRGAVAPAQAGAAVGAGVAGAGRQGGVTGGAGEPRRTQAGVGGPVVQAAAPVGAGAGFTVVHVDLAEVAGKPGGAEAGGVGRQPVVVGAGALVLARRAVGPDNALYLNDNLMSAAFSNQVSLKQWFPTSVLGDHCVCWFSFQPRLQSQKFNKLTVFLN
ncbi:hypothetical protein COCON_G00014440 [Conger conger]|uniref:Uncharacterized protein n=1 Tax=Conger conger TaxID=82655 RepID=A0A9Q1E370_CONCO|nr:hypothetical protein COCON_G00014440 [Conger conger]